MTVVPSHNFYEDKVKLIWRKIHKNHVENTNTSSMINTDLQETIQIRFIQIDCGTVLTQKKSQEIQYKYLMISLKKFQIKVPKN